MKLQVIMLDTCRTQTAIVHEQEWIPYRRRLVTVELTPEQCEQLRPRVVAPGAYGGKDGVEELGPVWLETTP